MTSSIDPPSSALTSGFASPLATLLSQQVGGAPEMTDLGFHQGIIAAWNPLNNTNTVLIAGTPISNLPILAAGTVMIGQGDVVGVLRVRTQYFILGRISHVSQALQIRAAFDSTTGFPTGGASYGDLSTGSGPTLTDVYIGPSRQCLVFISCGATASDMGYAAAHYAVSGASTINPPTGTSAFSQGAFVGSESASVTDDPTQVGASATRIFLVTAENGLNEGLNTFTIKYLNVNDAGGLPTNNDAFFFDRALVVFPL